MKSTKKDGNVLRQLSVDFEKVFPIPAHWIEWSETKKRYTCFVDLADTKCVEYNKMFEVWTKRQSEVDDQAAEIKRLEYMLGNKGEHPHLKSYLEAEVHRRHEEKKTSPGYKPMSKEDIEQLIKEVVDDCEQNPDKYQRNLYQQVDDLQKRLDAAYIKLVMLRQTELWREDDIFELFEELEQALRGGES